MKFFMMSKCGEGLGLLLRLQQEGNQVRAYIHEQEYYSAYDGMLKKEKTCNPEKDEIVIMDSSGSGREADSYRKRGLKVFSGSSFADRLENDRKYGLDFMRKCGIKVPETHEFKKFSDGYKFLKENSEERYVFKPSGDLPSKLTYVGKDSEDLISYMRYVEKYYGKNIDDFVLQCFVEGTIVSSEFWCGLSGFIHPGNQTVEVKKFLNDDLGPSTGCSGNLVWYCSDSQILKQGIEKAEKELVKEGFVGPIDLNAIFNEDGVFGLEWTPRFGLDAMPTLLQIIDGDVGKLISDIVNDQADVFPYKDEFAGGVRLTIPPYPIETKTSKQIKTVENVSPSYGLPICMPQEYEDSYYYYEVKLEEGQLIHSDGTGVIAVVSCSDKDCEEAIQDCYDILDEVKIPDKQYRTDLVEVLSDMYKEVEENELCLA